ncbi:MAG: hypothetical protein Q4C14_05835 [Bacillota bacterium]|nr:hypothetical protein [Bacillota bacterium]
MNMKIKPKTKLKAAAVLIIAFIYLSALSWAAVEAGGICGNEDCRYGSEWGRCCRSIGAITREECFIDENGEPARGFEITDVRPGDVFLTASTHTLFWRHGHAAIVTDTEPLRTLEAEVLGTRSRIVEEPVWERYTTFVQLRLKDEYGGEAAARAAAEYGKEKLTGCPYGFFCSKNTEKPSNIHCAFLVWTAYRNAGVDIDADGGIIVTPRDIMSSACFDTVMSLGIRR